MPMAMPVRLTNGLDAASDSDPGLRRKDRHFDESLRRKLGPTRCCVSKLRQAEIENLGLALPGDENVGRLNITMDDALAVGSFQSRGNLHRQVQQIRNLQPGFPLWLGSDQIAQRLPLQQLHRQKWLSFVFFDAVNGADVRMVQRRSRARFRLKALPCSASATISSGRNFNATLRPNFKSSPL